MLVDCVWPSRCKGPFLDVKGGVEGGIADYAIPVANATIDTPLVPMPRRRTIQASSVWDYRYYPLNQNIFFHPLDNGKYLFNSISVRVGIINQAITLQVPYQDWLAKPENDVYRVRARADRIARRSPCPPSQPSQHEAAEPRTIAIIARFCGRSIY
jgi:hypothetical protein